MAAPSVRLVRGVRHKRKPSNRFDSVGYLRGHSICYYHVCMTLNDYLKADGSLTVAQLRAAIGAKSDAQIRQWQHGYDDRLPSPENCTAIEQATGRAVMRWDLRPDDWWRIWPELISDEHPAPAVPTERAI